MMTWIHVPILFALAASPASAPSTGRALFASRCGECHTIGGGELVGPDLAPVRSWGTRKIGEALDLMNEEYLDEPLSAQERRRIVAWLRGEGAGAAPADAAPPSEATAREEPASPALIQRGEAIFRGDERLQAGGPPCGACHARGGFGGTLAPGLDRYGEGKPSGAVAKVIQRAAFRVMRPIYRGHEPTEDEAVAIAAYLTTPSPPRVGPPVALFVALGVGLAILALVGLGLRRKVGGVRRELVTRARRRRATR